jgi:hypothetical protein
MPSRNSLFEMASEPPHVKGDDHIQLADARLCTEMSCSAISTSEVCPSCTSSTVSLARLLDRKPLADPRKANPLRMFRLVAQES